MLSDVDFAINTVALYYRVDPDAVEHWPFTKFARREEYMFLRREINRQDSSNG